MTFNTSTLAECIPLSDSLIKVEKRGVVKKGESKRDKIKRRSAKKQSTSSTGFCNNSLTIVVLSEGDGTLLKKEITVKIFQNGVFHMTGVLDDKYDHDVMKYLLHTLSTDCKECMNPEIVPEVLNRRVVLMNYTTQLMSNATVAREQLHTAIRAMNDPTIQSHYDPDVYPGVKIRIGDGNWTAKVFRTGKIILTGVVSHDECLELISRLLDLFESVLPKKLSQVAR
uniref:Uncharacterized protein n=1 Tax=viral metagenome TaxID=1070528 RepID=A0A6C0JWH7_9ZZZZ